MKNLFPGKVVRCCALMGFFAALTGISLNAPAAIVLPPSGGPTNNTSGLVLWWTLDEGSGSTTADLSGNGYTGTLNNSPSWTTGMITNGLSFNAANSSYASSTAPSASVSGSTGATLCAWIQTSNEFAVGFNDTMGTRLSIIAVKGTLYFQAENGGPAAGSCAYIPDGRWHWFALSYNGLQNTAGTSAAVSGYIDGSPVVLAPPVTSLGSTLAASLGNFTIGKDGVNSAYYSMSCDDVRLYNRPLSYAEITNQYQWPTGNRTFGSSSYYIDYSAGSDSNTGLSPSSPWQHHPYMQGWTGGRYNHFAGDRFIFRGGATWPNSSLPLLIPMGGSGSMSMDYYGVTNNWFVGGAWTRPIFDAGSIPISGSCGNEFINFGNTANNVIIDNFEMKNFYWNSSSQGYGVGYVGVFNQTNIQILNCYLHAWSHDTAANGCLDNMQCITGSTTGWNPGCVCSNCVFDGSPNGTDSGQSLYCFPVAQNCVFQNMVCGPLPNGDPCIMSGCTVGPLNLSFTGRHGAGFEPQGLVGTQYCFNNVFHDCSELNINIGGAAGPTGVAYIYNNIVYNSSPGCILLKYCTGATNTAYIFNNFLDSSQGGSYAILEESGQWTYLAEQNNLEVTGGSSGSFSTLVRDHNISLSAAQVSTFTKYQSSSLRFNPNALLLVGSGTNLSGLNMLTSDMMGYPRPINGNWDIGPYCLRPTWKLP